MTREEMKWRMKGQVNDVSHPGPLPEPACSAGFQTAVETMVWLGERTRPRVPFSAPRGKCRAYGEAAEREARSATPEGGCAPQNEAERPSRREPRGQGCCSVENMGDRSRVVRTPTPRGAAACQ